jgi:hypothetical protein
VNRFVRNCLISGTAGGVLSHLAASLCSSRENARSELPMHAVSHIAWGDSPHSHRGRTTHNFVTGSALHHGACVFWATFFEALFGRRAEKSTSAAIVGGASIATAAYITDYHIVSDRFKPGFEAHLSNRSLFIVYVSLALGLAAGARLRGLRDHHGDRRSGNVGGLRDHNGARRSRNLRGFRDHEIEDHDEREESREAERRPDAVVAPEQLR